VFIPYNTDAPLYHLPISTVGLIAVNTLVFIASAQAETQDVAPWILQFGEGLHPLQWISNNFMHADFMHLLGNMFFLWGFGLVVEGKLGWWRFLLLYLSIGVIHGFVIQVAMLGSSGGGALGASGVIFGLMAIALIWAPKNEMSCFIWFVTARLVDVPITVFAGVYLLWQFTIAMLTRFSMSSAMLHLTGAGIGAIFGVVLLKRNLVDCEGWDLFAVRAGREGERRDKPVVRIEPPVAPPPKEPLSAEQARFFVTVVKNRLASGDLAGAAQFYQQRRELNPVWRLEEADLLALIRSLTNPAGTVPFSQPDLSLASASIRPMLDYIRQFPETAARVQFKLAQILIDIERRPAKALKLLRGMDASKLAPELQSLREKLCANAEQLLSESDLEIADGDG